MATYQVTTDKGTYEIDTDNAGPSSGSVMPKMTTEEAQHDVRVAQMNATPLGILSKAVDMSSAPAENAMFAGLPDIISQKLTGKSYIPPDSQMQGLSSAVGFAAGIPGAIGMGASGLVKGAGLLANVGRGAVGGAASLASLLPSPSQAPTLQSASDQILNNAKMGAIGGAVLGGASVLSKAKSLTDHLLGLDIQNKYVPAAEKIYQDAVNKFTPQIQDFAVNKVNVPQEVVDHISQRTPQQISASSNAMNNSQDTVFQMMKNGMEQKNSEVGEAYRNAFNTVPADTSIATPTTFKSMGDTLKKYGYINNSGNPLPFANSIGRDPALGQINDFYQSMRPATVLQDRLSGGQLPLSKQQILDTIRNSGAYRPAELTGLANKLGVSESDLFLNPQVSKSDIVSNLSKPQMDKLGEYQYIPLNKYRWSNLRDTLSNMRGNNGLSSDITGILDSLHGDAEAAGIPVQQARELAAKNFEMQGIAKKFITDTGENKLNNIFKMTGEQSNNLSSVDRYLGTNLSERAKDIAANDQLQNIYNQGISHVLKPSFINQQVDKYSGIMPQNIPKAMEAGNNLKSLLGNNRDLNSLLSQMRNRRILIYGGVGAGKSIYDKAKEVINDH